MFRFDKRILYVLLAVCVISMVGQYISNPAAIITLLLSLPGVLIAITFHEYAHAFAAYKLGDNTAKMQGRLSLNPLKHIDPFGIIMLLFLHIGWGRPVQIDSRNFNRNISLTKAEAIVAIAGPLANFILAILFTFIYVALIKFNVLSGLSARMFYVVTGMIQSTIIVNIGLGIFNLIPLPPLDGSKVLIHFLPVRARTWFSQNTYIFYIIFMIIWITGIAGTVIQPLIYGAYKGIINLALMIFKI